MMRHFGRASSPGRRICLKCSSRNGSFGVKREYGTRERTELVAQTTSGPPPRTLSSRHCTRGREPIMWGLIMLSGVFVLLLGAAAVADLRDLDRGGEGPR